MQQRSSSTRIKSFLLHSVATASLLWSFNWVEKNGDLAIRNSYGSHFQHLTILSLAITLLTMLVSLLADITDWKVFHNIKPVLLYIVCPLESIVTVLYWSIVMYDRSLLIPKTRPIQLPLDFDLSVHLMPTVFCLLDYLFFSPPFSLSFKVSTLLYLAVAFSYMWWVEKCYEVNKFYAYPILAILEPVQKGILYGTACVLSLLSYIVLKTVHPYALPPHNAR
ncbi:endomembrane system protein, FAR-17a/AIG1-like protein family protein, AIG1 and ADTRP-like protein [Schizosaccharomyces osmophilus]|uniref:Endomembrane system protein, FAR-17a/AIG1-like protein family protein, AIG1 and ADTRP-like protein n=1 Tax=Schizosaccharomyces osmophilus TaxID=2545709 RepID=A0AAE9WCF4_9SCHI|nr:endomembrane system protein, FAR-17a/AIG1-like protein family protein, AIG1 and ADTRP-like protein [Schizosaccharomyces osmophilus]WBW72143.1 endomembrane system protein, FAR-17a/AIG1-like protein family protein, AIG1 and ADTRP-like protein [Schizosaccharomyces osmophilus]